MANLTQNNTQQLVLGGISPGREAESGTEKRFSLTVPVEIRLQVTASDDLEARQILNAILGGGKWVKNSHIGLDFSLRTK